MGLDVLIAMAIFWGGFGHVITKEMCKKDPKKYECIKKK